MSDNNNGVLKMSYDIIETLVVESKKQMKPASIVLLEGDIQFTRYLPLEIPQKVMPKFTDLKRYVQDFGRYSQRIQQDFILCGYYLNFIKRECLYRYSSYERGTNERLNREIRRMIPKGSDLTKYTDKQIQVIEDWMNNYPRQVLGFATPNELFDACISSI